MPRAFLVLNPVTGLIPPITRRKRFEKHFKQLGWEYDIYETTGKEDLSLVVHAEVEKGVDLIVASGGDGTVSGVANAMANTQVPLGILPTGTANIFAHDIGIPFDLDRALKMFTGEHDLLDIDLIQTLNRSFVMNLSVGLSSKTILQTEREQKKRFGLLAYAWNLIAILIGLNQEAFTIKVDGIQYKMRATEIMVVNSSLMGIRTLHQNINILPDDGKVEICIIHARTLLDWLAVLGNILIGHSERNTRFRCLDATQNIQIKSKQPLMVQGDGELLGKTPLDIKVLPNSLRVIIPIEAEPLINLLNPFSLKQNPLQRSIYRKFHLTEPEIKKN